MESAADGAADSFADRVHRIEFAVDWPPGHVAAYLVDGEEPVLVDAGPPGEEARETLVAGLAESGHEISEVAHLLVTHPHVDHVGQANALVEAADPTVYALSGVRERLAASADDLADRVRATAAEAGLPDDAADEAVEEAVWSLERNRELLPPGTIDVELADGETTTVAEFPVEPLHTPGHQADHACFRVPADATGSATADGDLLFSGDVLVPTFRAAAFDVGLVGEAYGAIDRFYGSYDRLAELAVSQAFPGHGPVFEDCEAAIAHSREDLDDLLAAVEAVVADLAPATPYEVASRRAEGARRLTPVLLDTVGALGSLEGRDRVTFDVEGGVRRYRPVE